MKNKKNLIIVGLLISINSFSQRDVFDESLNAINQINDFLVDCMISFLSFPESHSNTIIVYDQIVTIKNTLSEQQQLKYRNPKSILSKPKVLQYYNTVDKMEITAGIFIELLKPFMGHRMSIFTQPEMDALNSFFKVFEWNVELLNIRCNDAYFWEYSKNGCKIMFVENTLPFPDSERWAYSDDPRANNYIEVTCFDKVGLLSKHVIRGGTYKLIQFQDDENFNYKKLTKVYSVRK
jgi:hypothetical protein